MDETTTMAPETTTSQYGEYADVIETIKKFTEFITNLIQKVMDFFKSLTGKGDETTSTTLPEA